MLENTKKMIWISIAAVLWTTALIFAIHSEQKHSLTQELAGVATLPQGRSVQQATINPTNIDHFSGAQVLSLWRSRGVLKYDFVLNGQFFSHLNVDIAQDKMRGLDVSKNYSATYIRNQQGQLQTITLSLSSL